MTTYMLIVLLLYKGDCSAPRPCTTEYVMTLMPSADACERKLAMYKELETLRPNSRFERTVAIDGKCVPNKKETL